MSEELPDRLLDLTSIERHQELKEGRNVGKYAETIALAAEKIKKIPECEDCGRTRYYDSTWNGMKMCGSCRREKAKKIKMKQPYVVTLIGGIGNILQTVPFMAWLKSKGHEVIGRVHEDAYSKEICELISPCYHRLIEHGETVPNSIDRGGIATSRIKGSPEWHAWFRIHDFLVPRDVARIELDLEPVKSPSRVILAPCCKPNWPMKRWGYWNELIAELPNCAVVGLPDDGGELTGDFIDLRGKTSLRELAGMLADADYVIAEEGGIAHLACAAGTRTYVLYGGTDPVKNRPPFNSVQIMSSQYFACRPCQVKGWHTEGKGSTKTFFGCVKNKMIDGHAQCMAALSVSEVLEAVKKGESKVFEKIKEKEHG
jgi:ribosomal protein S14